ncbi:MAG: DUF3108 domain-containing protein [Burkholderiales bacterium]
MAVRPALIAALALAVLLAHMAAIDWLAAQWQPPAFKKLAKPMYTRQITQRAPSEPKIGKNSPSSLVQSARPAITSIATSATAEKPKRRAKKPVAGNSPDAATSEAAAPEPSRDDAAQTSALAEQAERSDSPQPDPEPLAQTEPPARKSARADEEADAQPADQVGSAPVPPNQEPASGQVDEQSAGMPAEQAAQTPSADDPLPGWPNDTRLTYDLSGNYNGELHGSAQVLWQHQGNDYEAMIEIDLGLLLNLKLKSQGRITAQGLAPRVYEELQRTRRRGVRLEGDVVVLNDGKKVNRPPGVQDTASQFVELAHRFATGQAPLEPGRTITLALARPGAVDSWTYDVVGKVLLATPTLGEVEAYHLKPRPLVRPGGNISAEIWFAPSLQYLPVQIKVSMNENTWVDLVVKRIDQR